MHTFEILIIIWTYSLHATVFAVPRVRRDEQVAWNGNWALGCDFPGNDFKNVNSKGEACAGICTATSGCTHYTWTSYNRGTCWMKKNKVSKKDARRISDHTAACGVVFEVDQMDQHEPIVWNWNWALGCDFPGNDLVNEKSRGQDCHGLCAGNSDCTHYTWTSHKGGTCWMKKNPVSKGQAIKISDQTAACGVVFEQGKEGPITWTDDWALSCDFPGNDFKSAKTSGKDCHGRCASTPGCTHYMWTSPNGGTCRMKNGKVSKSDAVRVRDQTAACGIVAPAVPQIETQTNTLKTSEGSTGELSTEKVPSSCTAIKMSWNSRVIYLCQLPGAVESTEEACSLFDDNNLMATGTVIALECRPPFSSEHGGAVSKRTCKNGKWMGENYKIGACQIKKNDGHQNDTTRKNTIHKNSSGKITCPPLNYGSPGVMIECVHRTVGGSLYENDCSSPQSVGTEAKYSCLNYYEAAGALTTLFRSCESNGLWTGSGESFSCRTECGRANRIEKVKLITNGLPTVRGQFPWHAALFLHSENSWSYICGGTLIGRKTILTAAHCVTVDQTSDAQPSNALQIDLGKFKREEIDSLVQIAEVELIYVHPNYNPFTYDSDLAVVTLKSEVIIGHSVRPICFPQTTSSTLEDLHLVEGSVGTVVGFGLDERFELSDELHMAKMSVLGPAECLDILRRDSTTIQTKSTTYCAEKTNGSNVCNGDSGGGMYFTANDAEDTKWYLQGVVSVGIGSSTDPRRCDPDKPSIFTRVGRYADWIIKTLSKNN